MPPSSLRRRAVPTRSSRPRLLLCIVVAALAVAASCQIPGGTGAPSVPSSPPYCPFDQHLVMYGGDSIAAQWPSWVTLPSGASAFNTARGGSAYGGNYSPGMDTIGARIDAQLDACGNNVGTVAVSGGVNDISQGQPISAAIAGIQALDADLHARGIDAIFLTIHPVADGTAWFGANQSRRQAVNTWMTTPGHMYSRVVNCSAFLESSPGSDVLASQFRLLDAFGQPDSVHLSTAGYQSLAACAEPAIRAALS